MSSFAGNECKGMKLSGCPEPTMRVLQLRMSSKNHCSKKGKPVRTSAEKSLSNASGNGKKNTVEPSSNNSKNSAHHAIGNGNVLRWTMDSLKQSRKFLSAFIKKGSSTGENISSTGARSITPPSATMK